jgi:hemerythrin superfamily protein
MSEHKLLQELREDHQEQKRLGRELVETEDPGKREHLRRRFYESVYPHMLGEEASIFRRLSEDDGEARADALEGLEEHHVAKVVLGELLEMPMDGDAFTAKAKVLDELNRHHIDEEEDDVFEHLRERCTDEELDRLYEQYERAEQRARS